ncbi:arsenate reductase family protein [Bifidobacterium bombi]|uniref:ArsC family protein n=1 Tax=Bifidobacterium bombi DSM 19703 TaxID=1341695 RepID=A0A080N2Z0_9BIFI|nr:arsenate reductase family protein [Bifidobacterium bombi]KFF31422.1 ArsC family protein [Bifidobacterium bombi DSM 19703]
MNKNTNTNDNGPNDSSSVGSTVFLCYEHCSTCARARKWLTEHGVPYAERDIKTDNPDEGELTEWYRHSDLPIKRFFNTSGQRYRQLHLSEKLRGMNDEEALRLLSTDGMLVRRPILVSGNMVLVGFDEKTWESAFRGTARTVK